MHVGRLLSLSVRWVPSEYNTSDELSRGETATPIEHRHTSTASSSTESSRHQSRCCHTIAASQKFHDFKKENAKITTSHGQCGGTLTCRDTNSCANSSCGSQKQEKASTNFKHPFRYEKESRCDPDTKPEKVTGVL